MPTSDERYAQWVERLERIIEEVYNANLYRHVWRELAEITQAADLPASLFFDALGIWYATTQTASVRRQLDRRRGVVSLIRLIEEISRHPEVMTRERHVQLWTAGGDEGFASQGEANFNRFASNDNPDRLDLGKIRADVASLEEAGEMVQRYVNEAIAHTADHTTHEVPTFADLKRSDRRDRQHRQEVRVAP